MPSPEITASMHEQFALLIAKQPENIREIYAALDQRIKDLMFAAFQDGYCLGGQHGAAMAAERTTKLARDALLGVLTKQVADDLANEIKRKAKEE